jgi:hypothetical protein
MAGPAKTPKWQSFATCNGSYVKQARLPDCKLYKESQFVLSSYAPITSAEKAYHEQSDAALTPAIKLIMPAPTLATIQGTDIST